ncbi:MAG: O-acetyl-ADP-ribose deacetylase [Lachnospiraceae bacterium]|nr:O-acetyl-ADP-ribose deacetylase [Lachnospiraceae bacterium]
MLEHKKKPRKPIREILTLTKGDITNDHRVQAIVNAANTSLLGGGGVDGAIHRAAGPELLFECRLLNGCKTGQAKITKAYRLPCDYVIHTPGPHWNGGRSQERELLASCYRSCLELAVQHGIRSLAFPSISTGIYRFPLEEAAEIALRTAMEFAGEHAGAFDRILWVLFDEGTLAVYKQKLEELYEGSAETAAQEL